MSCCTYVIIRMCDRRKYERFLFDLEQITRILKKEDSFLNEDCEHRDLINQASLESIVFAAGIGIEHNEKILAYHRGKKKIVTSTRKAIKIEDGARISGTISVYRENRTIEFFIDSNSKPAYNFIFQLQKKLKGCLSFTTINVADGIFEKYGNYRQPLSAYDGQINGKVLNSCCRSNEQCCIILADFLQNSSFEILQPYAKVLKSLRDSLSIDQILKIVSIISDHLPESDYLKLNLFSEYQRI